MQGHFAGCELNAGHERCLCDARRYWIGIALSGAIMTIQLAGAWFSKSLALAAEGGHALVDGLITYGWAIFVAYQVYRHPKAEARLRRIGSIVNGTFFMAVGATIIFGVIVNGSRRIDSVMLAITAATAIILNAIQYRMVALGEGHSTNIELNKHNLGDIFEGLTVLATSAVIAISGWMIVDRLVAGGMAAWFLYQGAIMIAPHHEGSHRHHHHHH